jgi:RNA-dependent RNA polymerase
MLPDDVLVGHPDIKRNGYNFTDGAGHISLALAASTSELFGLTHCSSAFQVRIGGAKGVLMIKPDR